MRLPMMRTRSFLLATLLAVQTYADTVSLTQFQQIAGFPSECTSVYEGVIAGCTSNDFEGGPCSLACVDGLNQITSQLRSACDGISTSPTTLIGVVLRGKAVSQLCPKITSSVPSSSAAAAPTAAAPTSASAASTTSSQGSTTSTPSSLSTSSSTTAVAQDSSTINTIQSSLTTATTVSLTGVATPANTNFGGSVGNLNGGSNAAPNLHSNLFSISLVVAGLTIYFY